MNNIVLNDREIIYELERKKVKNINLRIRADGTVYVSANDKVSLSVIEEFLNRKSAYILAAIDKYAELAKYFQNERAYVTGESYRYLGKELRLKLSQGGNSVHSDGVYLYLVVNDVNNASLKAKVINKWADARCRELFPELIAEIHPIFGKYGIAMPRLILRDMTSRWGSCQPKRGIITLNKRLIEAPRNCIEYVVMHEFIHFLQANHSKKFYELLSTLMPDWKERKRILESGEYHQIIIKRVED
ncbi:MAG: M48 family metallopeptidase [Christensenellaceae bacterium]|jgi:predicted metal-dependent hydrolase|nr:M48 family metallopeptidase [Christensenellaceae bacterium]